MERRPSRTRGDETIPEFTLEHIDEDGAIQEAVACLYGDTRADFLRKAAVGGTAILSAAALPPTSLAARSKKRDVAIFRFGLNFEYLQSTFYTESEQAGTVARMGRRKAFWAKTLGAHERAHVAIIKDVLGSAAPKKPSFNFHGNTETESSFTKTAVAMEDLTTALLTGIAPALKDKGLIAAAFSLLTVEARHAAWARHLAGVVPIAAPFDQGKNLDEVDRVVASTRFISSLRPKTTARGRPKFTG